MLTDRKQELLVILNIKGFSVENQVFLIGLKGGGVLYWVLGITLEGIFEELGFYYKEEGGEL